MKLSATSIAAGGNLNSHISRQVSAPTGNRRLGLTANTYYEAFFLRDKIKTFFMVSEGIINKVGRRKSLFRQNNVDVFGLRLMFVKFNHKL